MSVTTEEKENRQQTMEELCMEIDFRARSKAGKQYCSVNNEECQYYMRSERVSVERAGIGFGNSSHYVSYCGCRRLD